jgi:hypothetical protein
MWSKEAHFSCGNQRSNMRVHRCDGGAPRDSVSVYQTGNKVILFLCPTVRAFSSCSFTLLRFDIGTARVAFCFAEPQHRSLNVRHPPREVSKCCIADNSLSTAGETSVSRAQKSKHKTGWSSKRLTNRRRRFSELSHFFML